MRFRFVVLVFLLCSLDAFSTEPHEVVVTCALPNDQQIWPTPESHIVLKRLDSPFKPNTKARFWISKRQDDLIWDIQTYEIWNEQFHRKPETQQTSKSMIIPMISNAAN